MRTLLKLGAVAALVLLEACSESTEAVPEAEGPPPCAAPSTTPAWTVADRFCRDVTTAGLTLVDWDGHIGNPAITMTLLPPLTTTFPAEVTVTSDEPRVYFDAGSRPERKNGETYSPPSFTHTFEDATPFTFTVAIWPDRDPDDDDHVLKITGGGATTEVPIHVLDQDRGPAPTFTVTVDFSKDAAQPDGKLFFDDPVKREIIKQAADDWAYFLDGEGLDAVPAGDESTMVDDPDGWYGARPRVTNASAYTGFLLYAVGIHTMELRSTGFPTQNAKTQSYGGKPRPGSLCRSGAIEMETQGNYSSLGWSFSSSDDDWYVRDNLADVPVDFASIAHHEIGHALFFDAGYAKFERGVKGSDGKVTYGTLTSAALRAYYPGDPPFAGDDRQVNGLRIDDSAHFSTGARVGKEPLLGAIDPASGLGAFGNEYADTGKMPRRRWIITKLDLLAAEAVGYPLRRTLSPFVDLALEPGLANARAGAPYDAKLAAKGGVPAYRFTVTNGALPRGVKLDSFTGALSGTPTVGGTYTFEVTLEDSLGASTTASDITLVVE